MKIKIWKVEIGNNFTSCNVIAKTIIQAIGKALINNKPIPREHNFIRKAELIAEADY